MSGISEGINQDIELQSVPSPQGAQVQQQTSSTPVPTGFSVAGQPGPVITFSSGAPVNGVSIAISPGSNNIAFSIVGAEAMAGIKCNFAAVVAPTANDDSSLGYEVGSEWIDTVLSDVYKATDVSVATAIWRKLN